MKTIKVTALLLFLFAGMWMGCAEDKKEILEPATLELSQNITIDWQGNPQEILVKTNKDSWLATVNEEAQEWCLFTPKRDRLVVEPLENYDVESRTATITVTVEGVSKSVTVTQEKGVDPELSVEPDFLSFIWQGGTDEVTVKTNQKTWKADTDMPDWCKLKQNGNILTIKAEESSLKVNRQAIVTITAGKSEPITVTVVQLKKESPIVGISMAFDVVTDFSKSAIYNVWNADQKVAEICQEYIPQINDKSPVTVVYPIGENGQPDLASGFVVTDGGNVMWDKTTSSCIYTPGELTTPATRLYVNNHTIWTQVAESANAQVLPYYYKDAEQYEYPMVKIGVQYWMKENLRTKVYADGSTIGVDFSGKVGAWGLYSDRVSSVEEKCGLLYNWYALNKMAPTGWHVPTQDDWMKLRTYLGEQSGTLLKTSDFWLDDGGNGTDLSGFSGYPGGYRWTSGKFTQGGYLGCFWSVTPGKDESDAFWLSLSKDVLSEVQENNKMQGASVRFLKD